MKVYTILLGASAIAALTTVAMSRLATPPVAVPVQAAEERFEQAWDDTMKVVGHDALKKANQLAVAIPADPRPVPVEKITPDAPTKVPPIVVIKEEKASPPVIKRKGGDLCSRHGMRKVMVNKYKWRCRK